MIEFKTYKDGKKHIVTFSYDDGAKEDYRLVEIFNKYGMKGTFNLNSGRVYADNEDVSAQDLKSLYEGHEVAVHTVNHPWLEKCPSITVINQVVEDRKALEKQCGYVVRGMAYPFGTYNDDVISILKNCGIVYSRIVGDGGFGLPSDFMQWKPTCHHNNATKYIDNFINCLDTPWASNLFYIWGHSFELGRSQERGFDYIEGICKRLAEHKDKIWFATNIEIYDYINAQRSLHVAADESFIYNPTQIDVWVTKDWKDVKIPAGETVTF